MKRHLYQTVSPSNGHVGGLKILLLCLASMFTLTACGGSEDITEENTPSVEEPEPDEKTEETKYTPIKSGGLENELSEQNTPSGWTAVELPQLPTITESNTCYITDYGASTSSDDNTEAVQKAIDAIPAAGGRVVVPPGEWLCGPIVLKSKTILYLADGATLKLLPFDQWTYTMKDGQRQYANFISCESNATDIVVEGESKTGSIIEGQGAGWWVHVKGKGYSDEVDMKRGAVIRFSKGQRFLIKNITIQNSPGVNITISESGNASHGTVHDVIIREPSSSTTTEQKSHNTDGISMWGPYINIYNCDISNGDDNVVADSNTQYAHVWNCKFGDGHGASLGSYTSNMHDILYEDITFDGTESGFRLKSQRGRSGDVYNITCRNCTMTGVNNPIYIECWYDKSTKPVPAEAESEEATSLTPAFRDILLQNITSTGTAYNTSAKGYFPIYMYGLPESHIKNVTFDNVQIEAQKGMFLAYCDGVVFKNSCKITNTKTSSQVVSTCYEAEVTGDYGAVETPVTGEDASYTLDTSTSSTASGATTYTFSNGCTITNEKDKTYGKGNDQTIKYSAGVQYTINLPSGFTVTSVTFEGYDNYTEEVAYIGEVNGTSYGASEYVFPSDKSTVTHTITLDNAATGALTFTPKGKQICVKITLNGKAS